jgi:dTDP-4-dehydrorhamnose reductase
MKILVTGANGLLGQHLVKLLLSGGYHVLATGKGPSRIIYDGPADYAYFNADITDGYALEELMDLEKPGVVIHAAAMTQVDIAEQNPKLCSEINIQGTGNVLRHAEKYSGSIVYISTDFVFDGEKGNYAEEDKRSPVNWYGRTKMDAENIIVTSQIPWTIVRTCLVYGDAVNSARSHIISWVKEKLENKEKIKVVNDQVRTPTFVEDLAKGVLLAIEKKATGIFHISGADVLTPYQVAIKTADVFGLDKSLVEKVDAATFTQPARRPAKTGFNIEKAKRELGYTPLSFEEALRSRKKP